MEQRFQLGRPGGVLTVRDEGAKAVFEAQMPDDRQGLYKVYLTGGGGSLLLGTLMPENGALRLRRTLTVAELKQKGCWPVTRGEARLAYSFGAAEQSGIPGWTRENDPARLMGDRVLAHAAAELRGALLRREAGGFALAAPVEQSGGFPMSPLFCFAHVETLQGRPYAVFHFNAHGCPIFPNRENQTDHICTF